MPSIFTPHQAFIGIGANLGDPLDQCRSALKKIAGLPATRLKACSSFYKTPPLVRAGENADDVNWYVNAVCCVETRLEVWPFLEEIHKIENEMGRVRNKKWEPRVIDLDLLFYDNLIINTPQLSLPHPGIEKRDFVLGPLAEIAGEIVHPRLKMTLNELGRNLPSITTLEVIAVPLEC